LVGFDVRDQIVNLALQQPAQPTQEEEPQTYLVQNSAEIDVEIVQMELVGIADDEELMELLGPNAVEELRVGGLQENLPWIPVENERGPISEMNPVFIPPDSNAVVTLDDPTGPMPGLHPQQPIVIQPEGFLIARNRMRDPAGTGEQQFRWIWHIHGAHSKRFGELDDAPDSTNSFMPMIPMTAYPWGVMANYPTVLRAGSPWWGPFHWFPCIAAHLGHAVTWEHEADIGPDQDPTNNIQPWLNKPNLDLADDGVLGMPLKLPHCKPIDFKYLVNVTAPVPANLRLYTNVWFDWNRDGDWDDVLPCAAGGAGAPELAVQDQVLTGLSAGMNTIKTPKVIPWHPFVTSTGRTPPIWMRITLSERPWPYGGTPNLPGIGGAGPAWGYQIGETEGYYFRPRKCCCRDCPDLNCDGWVDLEDLVLMAAKWLHECD
jgi:hypothetical protein